MFRVGQGIDFHQLVKNSNENKFFLGGVPIDSEYSIVAHSDGDIVLHALSDAILGAIGEKDIGEYFPDTDPANKNIDSKKILEKALTLLQEKHYFIQNIDITIVTEVPRIKIYRDVIQENIANLCTLEKNAISIKATTTEKLGFIGRKEGIGCFAIVLIQRN